MTDPNLIPDHISDVFKHIRYDLITKILLDKTHLSPIIQNPIIRSVDHHIPALTFYILLYF